MSTLFKEIYVTDFTEASAHKFRRDLLLRSFLFPEEPVRVYIDSHGGDLESLATMIATMQQVPNQIHTIAIGKAMSAGAILLSHGDVRYADKRATIMIHSVQLFDLPDMDMEDFRINEKEIKRINRFWLTTFAENCGMKYKELRELFSKKGKEIYLNAGQARNMGIVDYAYIPKLKHNDILAKGPANEEK